MPGRRYRPQQGRECAQGRDGLDDRFGKVRWSPALHAEGWVDVVPTHGPERLEQVWREVASSAGTPGPGHVVRR